MLSTPSAIACSALLLVGFGSWLAAPASAEPRGLTGSYIGVAIDGEDPSSSFNSLIDTGSDVATIIERVLDDRPTGAPNGATVDRQLQGRLDVPNAPISVRATAIVGDDVRAVLPTLSYDFPVGNNANLYAGAGYVFITTPGTATPLGDRNGVVLTAGAETAIGEDVVIYGDVRFRPDAQRQSETSQTRVQVGIGRRF
ncbi:MAG: porin family protein [Leptolyngbyaceae cyanobacterium SL_7_1]|nr:porin family protein [Leptolyngbyaceae cyanobacterium SL_7_1]